MVSMPKVTRIAGIGLLIMALLSFGNFFGQTLAAIVIPFGVVMFFTNRALERAPDDFRTLSVKPILQILSQRENVFWLLLPAVMTLVNVLVSSNFFPQYIEYEKERAGAFISIEMSLVSLLLFFVFALGEEIAWRAFFQKQLMKWMSPILAISFSSLLFTLGHYQVGNTAIVLYGLMFIFINSCLYGIIYYKTKNVWISTLAHFLANIIELFIYTL